MMQLVMLILPAVGIIAFVKWKMPPNVKDYFFMIPIWISSALMAYLIGHSLGGVMGGYAGILCDFVLMPAFSVIKKMHEKSKNPKPKRRFSLGAFTKPCFQ